MSKVGASYDSVVLGVSEQVAHDRRSGQHAAQDNMISDPVRGLVRRRGSVYVTEQDIQEGNLEDFEDALGAMREFTFVIDGVEYSAVYRTQASANGKPTFMFVYNKATSTIIPVVYENSTWVNTLVSGGASAIANVGRYLYIAGRETIPTIEIDDVWNTDANNAKMVAWVRGGNYSTTFSLTLTKDDATTLTVSYQTLPSAYPTLLDVSGIEFWADPPTNSIPREDYQKDLNDAVFAHNSAATAYIGEAAADITGENIAQKLVDELLLAGVAASRQDSTVIIDDDEYITISADDGGDNTLIRAVGREVAAPTLMSTIHYVGKVVRIRPQGASDREAFYLKAFAKDNVSTGWTEVVWREAAGVEQQPTTMFAQAVIHEGTMYVAQNGAGLLALAPTSGEHPEYKASSVGDVISSPTPEFFGKRITMLSVFQDRLLIGSGGVVNASRNGDYLNFFRQSVLQIPDNDPVEMYAIGAEGDTLRHAVMYDRDLLIFGDLRQYGITGKQVLSAKSPNITTVSAHEDTTSAPPIASGNFVFYGKNSLDEEGDLRTTMHQLQVGQLLESPVSHEVTQQLDQYIRGTPCQLLGMTSPNMVYYRTEEEPNTIYTYLYVDTQDGAARQLDSWSRWKYTEVLGRMCGISAYKGSILVFTVRQVGDDIRFVVDRQSLNTELSSLPYLDSACRYSEITGWHADTDRSVMSAAISDAEDEYMLGTSFDALADFLDQVEVEDENVWVGAVSPASFTLTNPYAKDRNEKSILSGRMTVSQLRPSFVDTGGCVAEVTSGGVTKVALDFRGRVLGQSDNLVGRQPIATAQLTIGVGREVRAYECTIRSKDWLPMGITAIEWIGHRFDRIRRVG